MKRRGGFTLIEVLVTMTIMVILMTLAVVNIRGTQVRARDTERRSDTESLAQQLDSLYASGFSFTYGGGPISFKGRYPTTAQMNDVNARTQIFSDLPSRTLIDPGKQTSSETIFMATNGKELIPPPEGGACSTYVCPTPGIDFPYVYQPLDDSGNLCINDTGATPQNCRRFNIYYRNEYDGKIQVVRSKYQ
jgi:prepilin-type N-terminal cleavage/methylation domain-containing protein